MTELPPPTVPSVNLRGAFVGSDPTPRAPRPNVSRPNGSRVVQALWVTVGGILAVAGLGWGTYTVISLLAHEEHTEQSSFAAADVSAVDIDNDNGSVTVTASDGDTVEITADVSDGWQATEVTSSVVDGVLELRASCPLFVSIWCSVDYTIAMPADRPLTIDGSGPLRVRGMTGPVNIDGDDGAVELDDIAGDLTVSNDNGRIVGRRLTSSTVDAQNTNGRIELSFLDPPQTVSARTENGRIDVVVPDTDVLYRVDLHTENGSTDNAVRTDPGSDHVIDLSTQNGSITLRPPG